MTDHEAQGQDALPKAEASQSTNVTAEFCCSTLSYLVFAILFGLYTSDVKYFESDLCVDLLKWGKIMYYLCAAGTIFCGVIAPIFFCSAACSGSCTFKAVSALSLYSIRVSLGVANLVIFIALCVVYAEGESCGDLRTLTLVYIILVGVAIGLAFVVGCCMCCCMLMGAGAGMAILGGVGAQQNNQGYGSVNGGQN